MPAIRGGAGWTSQRAEAPCDEDTYAVVRLDVVEPAPDFLDDRLVDAGGAVHVILDVFGYYR